MDEYVSLKVNYKRIGERILKQTNGLVNGRIHERKGTFAK